MGKHQPNRTVEVRLGQREDIPAVQTFLAEEGELSPVAIGVLAHADLVFWIAVEAGETVATILTRPLPFADGSMRGGADQLVVAAHRRNQGIGRRLMELADG